MAETDILKELLTTKEGQNDTLSFLGELEKHGKGIDMVIKILDRIEKSSVTPMIVRGIGQKLNIDVETPLQTTAGILPATDTHGAFYKELNKMPEEAVKNIIIFIQEKIKEAQNVPKEKKS